MAAALIWINLARYFAGYKDSDNRSFPNHKGIAMNSVVQDPSGEEATRSGTPARVYRGVRRWFSDWLARGALREQFEDLERSGCIDDVLIDLGISRQELESIIHGHPEASRLMPAMAQRLGIDLEKLDPRERYVVGQHCTACQSKRRCRQWLATASAESPGYRDFCPNAALFDVVLARIGAAAAARAEQPAAKRSSTALA